MAENQEKRELSPEETANLVNNLLAENKTLKAVISDTAEKIARTEVINSELKVRNLALQEALANATSIPVDAKPEEE